METEELFRVALAMIGLSTDTFTADMILQTARKFDSMKGEFSIADAVDIELAAKSRHQKPEEDI